MQLLLPKEVWLKLLRLRNLRANVNNAMVAGGKQRTRAISQFANNKRTLNVSSTVRISLFLNLPIGQKNGEGTPPVCVLLNSPYTLSSVLLREMPRGQENIHCLFIVSSLSLPTIVFCSSKENSSR